MAKQSKAARDVKKTKSDIAKTIREDILRRETAPAEEATQSNVESAQTIAKVAAAIEMMSDTQNDTLLEILQALEKIPQSLAEQEKQATENLEHLVKVIVELEKDLKKAEEAGDTEKADKLKTNIAALRGEADKQLKLSTQGIDSAPKTFGEGIAKMMGVSPTELREAGGGVKGFAKSLLGGTKEYVGSIAKPGEFNQKFIPTVEDRIRKEQEESQAKEAIKSSLGDARKAEIAEKIKNVPENLRIKVDAETGQRYRLGTKGQRINEFEESGAKNSRFEFGTMGGLVDEESGKNYNYGTSTTPISAGMTAAAPRSNVFEGESGTDTDTDNSQEEMISKLDDINLNLEQINATIEDKDFGGGGGGGGLVDNALDVLTSRGGRRAASRVATRAAARTAGKGLLKGGLRAAGRFARFAGPVGLAVTAGMGIYDAATGFNADENASTGDKFKNAGSSLLNSFSFGLLGKSSNEIREEAAARAAAGVEAPPAVTPTMAAPPSAPVVRPNRTAAAPVIERQAPATSTAPVIVDNSQRVNAPQVASAPASGASTVITVRDTHGSHMRFQDRRMVRVM